MSKVDLGNSTKFNTRGEASYISFQGHCSWFKFCMDKIQLVERHVINKTHDDFDEIDNLCFLSKNLYNTANFIIRQDFINNKGYISCFELQKLLQNQRNIDYYALPTGVSQQVLKVLHENWKSFFAAIKEYKKHSSKFLGMPKLPKYKDKISGRNLLIFTAPRLGKRFYEKTGKLKLQKTNLVVNSKVPKEVINQVRIVPQNNCYVIEVVYTKEIPPMPDVCERIASIDTGLNNLATLTSNCEIKPTVYCGKAVKSINQFYNKKTSELKSQLKGKAQTSKRIKATTHKRNQKVSDFLHKTSRNIVNQLVSFNIDTLVIGKNDNWKQDIKIGRVNNQKFVMIPHARFIHMLEYKCKIDGIKVILQEESYTSKTSFLDNEEIEKHEEYKGKRVKRGLFKSASGININADVNGSFNIMRKAFPNSISVDHGIEAFVVSPLRIKTYKT